MSVEAVSLQAAPLPGEHGNPMTVPLRKTPLAFRWWLFGCVLALPLSFVALLLWAPGPSLPAVATEPGAIILLALILLADLYPTLPWMRAANPFDDFIMSTPLSIAALIVFGPHAAVVFVVAGVAMTACGPDGVVAGAAERGPVGAAGRGRRRCAGPDHRAVHLGRAGVVGGDDPDHAGSCGRHRDA